MWDASLKLPTQVERPWEGPRACGCVAPGEPCPVCNRVDDDTLPELPEGFIVDIKAKDWD
jgi:hypothetical protein